MTEVAWYGVLSVLKENGFKIINQSPEDKLYGIWLSERLVKLIFVPANSEKILLLPGLNNLKDCVVKEY